MHASYALINPDMHSQSIDKHGRGLREPGLPSRSESFQMEYMDPFELVRGLDFSARTPTVAHGPAASVAFTLSLLAHASCSEPRGNMGETTRAMAPGVKVTSVVIRDVVC